MITYQQAVHDLYALGHELHRIPAHKFEIAQMRTLASALGSPETHFPSVLIAGTNGKGSTAATLASILQASGYRTGLYTSPHLVRINERIRLNGSPIANEDFARLYAQVHAKAVELVNAKQLPHVPSFFETMTAMAFLYFAEAKVDIAVLEVGMGGRLDATNIVEPIVSVITDIALDHQAYLGNTIAEIAAEKAGILRAGRTAITLPQHPQANDVLGRRMIEIGANAVSAARNVAPVSPGSEALVQQSEGRTRFHHEIFGKEVLLDSPLAGPHQLRNLALALTAAEELRSLGYDKITAETIAIGVRDTRWAARFQVMLPTATRPQVVLDVAHNPAGAWALRAALNQHFGERPRVFVFGAMRDKAIAEMAQILFPTAECVVATTADNPRSATADEIAKLVESTGARALTAADVPAAISMATQEAAKLTDSVIVITGS
ncbi:MAG TPA: folylpolyglutamate synthase/dihydrofolate synthase family protein, partial [Terriglobales bacterium]